MSGPSITIYGNGTKTFTVKPGDTPAGYPAPRDGEIFIRKAETNEILITIAVAQVDPILGTWSGTIAACGEPEPGETCIATEPRLFTVTFDSSTDSSPYSYFWTDITTGTRYSGAGMNWESTQSGNTWFGSADLHDVRDCLGHANITTTSRYVRSTPVRLAQPLARMGASAETVVDADDQPHLAAVR